MPLTARDAVAPEHAFFREIDPSLIRKIPTGIADLDSIVEGGFPSGSTVLLWGDIGAGMQEFVYTGASKIALVKENGRLRNYLLGHGCEDSVLPERICYITFSRSREAVLQELAASFNSDFFYAFRDATIFKDFSSAYFRHTVVPRSWTHDEGTFGQPAEDLLESLVDFLDGNADRAMVVIDSLTDLAETATVAKDDLVAVVKGLQRAAKGWDGIVYLLLTRGILEPRYEQMIVDSVDGCLVFEWKNYLKSSKRQRYMYVEKFTSVLPHLQREKIARFPTMITSYQGLVVVYMERIA
jgi:KaiC/GvpD/RAD55 family RecA-like ATPase